MCVEVHKIMADPRIKTIKIKTGVVKRLAKEKVMYEKEADEQRVRIQKLKDQGDFLFLVRIGVVNVSLHRRP